MAVSKKEAAKDLFFLGYKQVHIAQVLRLAEITIHKWAKAGQWKQKRASRELLKENSTMKIMEIIDYQVDALHRKMKRFREEESDEQIRLIERGDIDALQKLFTTIRKDALKFSDYATFMKEFFSWLENYDLDAAKDLLQFGDEFLNMKREHL